MAKYSYAPTWAGIQPLIIAEMLFYRGATCDEKYIGGFVDWLRMTQKLMALVPGDCGWGYDGENGEVIWPDRPLSEDEKAKLLEHFGWQESWYALRIQESLKGREPSEEPSYDEGREEAHRKWWRDRYEDPLSDLPDFDD